MLDKEDRNQTTQYADGSPILPNGCAHHHGRDGRHDQKISENQERRNRR